MLLEVYMFLFPLAVCMHKELKLYAVDDMLICTAEY